MDFGTTIRPSRSMVVFMARFLPGKPPQPMDHHSGL